MKEKLKVAELFAGVGGFRLGLEKSGYEVVWSNQWEPSTKTQHASKVYEARFGPENHSSEDIAIGTEHRFRTMTYLWADSPVRTIRWRPP